jgi:predicted nucleotidyltransferase
MEGFRLSQKILDLMEQYVCEIQKIYGSHLRKIILYGSYARGDYKDDSDIDIKPIAKNESYFKKWVLNYPFYANVNREGVILYEAA